jgi:hypothetical protein
MFLYEAGQAPDLALSVSESRNVGPYPRRDAAVLASGLRAARINGLSINQTSIVLGLSYTAVKARLWRTYNQTPKRKRPAQHLPAIRESAFRIGVEWISILQPRTERIPTDQRADMRLKMATIMMSATSSCLRARLRP